MPRRASISIFFSLIFAMIAALILTITESARSFSQRFYMQVALDSAMESLFSQYHRTLWERYRILGLEYREDGDLMDELHGFLLPYLDCKDLFPVRLERDDLLFDGHSLLSEGNVMEEEILEYMQFGLVESAIRFAEQECMATDLPGELRQLCCHAGESEPMETVQRAYQVDSRSLQAIEDALLEISKLCKEEQSVHESAQRCLSAEDADGFYRAAEKLQELWKKHRDAVRKFQKAADRLSEQVAGLRQRYEAEKISLGEESAELAEAEIREYESYISEKGTLREEIGGMSAQAEGLSGDTDGLVQEVRELEAWAEEALSELDEEDEGEEEIYEAVHRFYSSAERRWSALSLLRYEAEASVIHAETKRSLDNVRELWEGKFLERLFPSGAAMPSREAVFTEDVTLRAVSAASPLDIAVLGEYSLRYFGLFHPAPSSEPLPPSDSAQPLPPSGSTQLEAEYLLSGKDNDYENLSEVVRRLVLLRELMNLLFLYQTPTKRAAARGFVTTMLCVTANPILISVLTFFVLGVWAYGQALLDVQMLLENGRVPFLHTEESFRLSLEELLWMGKEKSLPLSGGTWQGLSYQDYLRIFLFGEGLRGQDLVLHRMQIAMQRNLRKVGEDASRRFGFSHCLYGVSATAELSSRHILAEQRIVALLRGKNDEQSYSFALRSSYRYKNDTM